jgi:hypothetical protein
VVSGDETVALQSDVIFPRLHSANLEVALGVGDGGVLLLASAIR